MTGYLVKRARFFEERFGFSALMGCVYIACFCTGLSAANIPEA
jgi:hypothetical protein